MTLYYNTKIRCIEGVRMPRNVDDGGVNYVRFLVYVYVRYAEKVDIIIINNNNNYNSECVYESYMRHCVRGVTTARGSRTAPTRGYE